MPHWIRDSVAQVHVHINTGVIYDAWLCDLLHKLCVSHTTTTTPLFTVGTLRLEKKTSFKSVIMESNRWLAKKQITPNQLSTLYTNR